MGIIRAIGRGTKNTLKSCVNVKGWVSYDSLKMQTNYLARLTKSVFGMKKSGLPARDFEEAIKEQNISEEDLARREKMFLRRAIWMTCLSAIIFVYAIVLLLIGHIYGLILGLIVATMIITYAYGMYLYYYQIKHRKLGCTFKEIFSSIKGSK